MNWFCWLMLPCIFARQVVSRILYLWIKHYFFFYWVFSCDMNFLWIFKILNAGVAPVICYDKIVLGVSKSAVILLNGWLNFFVLLFFTFRSISSMSESWTLPRWVLYQCSLGNLRDFSSASLPHFRSSCVSCILSGDEKTQAPFSPWCPITQAALPRAKYRHPFPAMM